MTKIQVDLPDDIDDEIGIHKIKNKLSDKREAVIDALRKYFKK